MSKKLDLIGERYGKLIVIEEAEPIIYPSGQKHKAWLCKCACGNYCKVATGNLRGGHVISCGCVRYKMHGLSSERLYNVWRKMKDRCYDENSVEYQHYGAKGVEICSDWLNDYFAFRAWMLEHGYDPTAKRGESTIDRIDVNKGYCPENCRIVDMKTQSNNRTNNITYTYQGATRTLPEWAEEYGLKYFTLRKRIEILHWDIEKALTTPVRRREI